jgi:hypothetical protein
MLKPKKQRYKADLFYSLKVRGKPATPSKEVGIHSVTKQKTVF